MNISSVAAPPAPTGDPAGLPKNPTEAAQQFEALLLTQMLQTVRAGQNADDPTSDTMVDMAAQQFAQVLSKNGGLGLARIIQKSLEQPKQADPPGLEGKVQLRYTL